jgi:hypothetical protein
MQFWGKFMRGLPFLTITLAICLGSCSEDAPVYSEGQRTCIAQHYKSYNPKRLDQCLAVCTECLSGTVATCNSSCKLKGAI